MAKTRVEEWTISLASVLAFTGLLVSAVEQARAQSQAAAGGKTVAAQIAKAENASDELEKLIADAMSDDRTIQSNAIQELRKRGQPALTRMMGRMEVRKVPRWGQVLDAVAQQKDAEYSGLYWHTDLNDAIAVARRENKPILSLRLLGKLTDELSCANSRFFRTTLYPNPAVRDLLTGHFVLHWQSVRAVPIVTIDFGDGRKIERTITGNSLHLILDENGRPLDVLPGLYAAGAFSRHLQDAKLVANEAAAFDDESFQQRRTTYHGERLTRLQNSWTEQCQTAGLPANLMVGVDHQADVWTKLSLPVAGADPVLSVEARRAVIERAPPAEVAGRLAFAKSISETPTMRLVKNVSRIINEDSVRNEYHLHARIHQWFAMKQFPMAQDQIDRLVSHVYADLFLSPLNDPWYGLSNPDVYSAIKNDGRIDAVTQNVSR